MIEKKKFDISTQEGASQATNDVIQYLQNKGKIQNIQKASSWSIKDYLNKILNDILEKYEFTGTDGQQVTKDSTNTFCGQSLQTVMAKTASKLRINEVKSKINDDNFAIWKEKIAPEYLFLIQEEMSGKDINAFSDVLNELPDDLKINDEDTLWALRFFIKEYFSFSGCILKSTITLAGKLTLMLSYAQKKDTQTKYILKIDDIEKKDNLLNKSEKEAFFLDDLRKVCPSLQNFNKETTLVGG